MKEYFCSVFNFFEQNNFEEIFCMLCVLFDSKCCSIVQKQSVFGDPKPDVFGDPKNTKFYHIDFTVTIVMFCRTASCKQFQSTKLNISLNS